MSSTRPAPPTAGRMPRRSRRWPRRHNGVRAVVRLWIRARCRCGCARGARSVQCFARAAQWFLDCTVSVLRQYVGCTVAPMVNFCTGCTTFEFTCFNFDCRLAQPFNDLVGTIPHWREGGRLLISKVDVCSSVCGWWVVYLWRPPNCGLGRRPLGICPNSIQ